MKTIDIKGKPYISVNERIKEFHKLYPNGSIATRIHSLENGVVVMRSIVTPDVSEQQRIFTGVAYEKEGSTFINKTSYVENCETSAVGRALGMLGIGIDVSIASADEVKNAVNNQTEKVEYINEAEKSAILDYLDDTSIGIDKAVFLKFFKAESVDKIEKKYYAQVIIALDTRKNAKKVEK